jgi:hypothetical protein
VYAALEQKAVDGQENPVATINGAKLYEVQKHLTLTGHQYNPQSIVISKKFWETLSVAESRSFKGSELPSTSATSPWSRGRINNMKKGHDCRELSPADQTKFVEKMKPVITKHAGAVGLTLSMICWLNWAAAWGN